MELSDQSIGTQLSALSNEIRDLSAKSSVTFSAVANNSNELSLSTISRVFGSGGRNVLAQTPELITKTSDLFIQYLNTQPKSEIIDDFISTVKTYTNIALKPQAEIEATSPVASKISPTAAKKSAKSPTANIDKKILELKNELRQSLGTINQPLGSFIAPVEITHTTTIPYQEFKEILDRKSSLVPNISAEKMESYKNTAVAYLETRWNKGPDGEGTDPRVTKFEEAFSKLLEKFEQKLEALDKASPTK